MNKNQWAHFTLIVLLLMISEWIRGSKSRYQKGWGNLTMRASEEPTDCLIVSKITHSYVPDFQEFYKHCGVGKVVSGYVLNVNKEP